MSAGTANFIVGDDKKLWVGSGLFKNSKSLFSPQGTVFGSVETDVFMMDWVLAKVV